MVSKEEMRKSVDSAIKVHELEGFKFTEEELAVFDRIANLEITTEEAREIFREKLAGKKEDPYLQPNGVLLQKRVPYSAIAHILKNRARTSSSD